MLESLLCSKYRPADHFEDIVKDLKHDEIKIEPNVTIEPIPDTDLVTQKHEHFIKVKSTSSLQTSESDSTHNLEQQMMRRERIAHTPPPTVLINNTQLSEHSVPMYESSSRSPKYVRNNINSTSTSPSYPSPSEALEPADLSNKKPENLTCVPEIEFIKEEMNDVASDYSNSSDPERLEVDMSQVS